MLSCDPNIYFRSSARLKSNYQPWIFSAGCFFGSFFCIFVTCPLVRGTDENELVIQVDPGPSKGKGIFTFMGCGSSLPNSDGGVAQSKQKKNMRRKSKPASNDTLAQHDAHSEGRHPLDPLHEAPGALPALPNGMRRGRQKSRSSSNSTNASSQASMRHRSSATAESFLADIRQQEAALRSRLSAQAAAGKPASILVTRDSSGTQPIARALPAEYAQQPYHPLQLPTAGDDADDGFGLHSAILVMPPAADGFAVAAKEMSVEEASVEDPSLPHPVAVSSVLEMAGGHAATTASGVSVGPTRRGIDPPRLPAAGEAPLRPAPMVDSEMRLKASDGLPDDLESSVSSSSTSTASRSSRRHRPASVSFTSSDDEDGEANSVRRKASKPTRRKD